MNTKMKLIIGVVSLFCAITASSFGSADAISSAREALDARDFEKARSLLVSIIEATPENAEAYFLTGRVEFEEGDFKASEASFRKAIELDDTVAEYYAQLGSALVNKASGMNMFSAGPVFMRGLDEYKRAIKVDNDNLHAHIGLCRYYWNAPAIGGGSMKKAQIHADEVARINPYLGHIENALVAQKDKRNEDAIEHYKAAIEMNPTIASVHYDLAKLYQETGGISEAEAAYEATLEIDPNHSGAKAALESIQ